MIYITGDTHGARDFYKLLSPELSILSKNDYVVICGDAGVLFNPEEVGHFINIYSYLPFTVLFIDGNHENFELLNSYPVEIWNGGRIHRISDSIIHLMCGQIFTIESKSFFTFGGALSFDKARRIEGKSWWKEEMRTSEDYKEALANLAAVNYNVDYVVSHDCPKSLMNDIAKYSAKLKHEGIIISKSNDYLEEFYKVVEFKHWFFAHYHIDLSVREKVDCLFSRLYKLF